MYYPDRMIKMFGAKEVRHYAKKFGLKPEEASKILEGFIKEGIEPLNDDAALNLINAYEDRVKFYFDEFGIEVERSSKIIADLGPIY